MPYTDEKFDVEPSSIPYSGLPRGIGRWFMALRASGQQLGFIWTDNNENVGLITTDTSMNSAPDVYRFILDKISYANAGATATDVFEAFIELQEDNFDLPVEIIHGDLEANLIQQVESSMMVQTAATYGMTFRDDGEVLELVRLDPLGQYLRVDGAWESIDPDADEEEYPTLYGEEWHDVTEDAVAIFDERSKTDNFTKADVQQFFIN